MLMYVYVAMQLVITCATATACEKPELMYTNTLIKIISLISPV